MKKLWIVLVVAALFLFAACPPRAERAEQPEQETEEVAEEEVEVEEEEEAPAAVTPQ
ncbi:MAG TPA: hypothetical protein VLH16_01370 [Bacteroidales bacterium]|nr:hypothetical protein [Bacteroidales bacterium]